MSVGLIEPEVYLLFTEGLDVVSLGLDTLETEGV